MLNNKFNEQLKGRETAIEDLNKLLEHQSEIHKVTLNEASLKISDFESVLRCIKSHITSCIVKSIILFAFRYWPIALLVSDWESESIPITRVNSME